MLINDVVSFEQPGPEHHNLSHFFNGIIKITQINTLLIVVKLQYQRSMYQILRVWRTVLLQNIKGFDFWTSTGFTCLTKSPTLPKQMNEYIIRFIGV